MHISCAKSSSTDVMSITYLCFTAVPISCFLPTVVPVVSLLFIDEFKLPNSLAAGMFQFQEIIYWYADNIPNYLFTAMKWL